jgi:hypothetical protein
MFWRTVSVTSSGVPKGITDWVPMVPSRTRSRPYSRCSFTGSMHSGWMGFRIVTPTSIRSGMISQMLPSLWYQTSRSGFSLRPASMIFARRGLKTRRQISGGNMRERWLATSSPSRR